MPLQAEGTSPPATTTTTDATTTNVQELVLCQARGKGTTMLRESYEARLRTFSSLKYFAKPACLSPLLCARLGFRNVATDMLQCTACKAALEIDIPSSLSATSRHSLTSQLEQQLEAVHRAGCRFRHDAAYYFGEKNGNNSNNDDNDKNDDELVPMVLAQVFRPEIMELLDPPKPHAVVRQRCKILLELLLMTSKQKNQVHNDDEPSILDAIQIPKQLLEYGVQEEDTTEQSMLSRVSETLFESDDENSKEIFNDKQLSVKVLALIVLGWSPINDDNDDSVDDPSHSNCQLECPICWSRYSLTVPSAAENERSSSTTITSPPPAKRARTTQHIDALQAHRHYCPFVCGFPRANSSNNKATTPLWQSLLRRLLPTTMTSSSTATATATATTPSRVEIFEMLQSGVSRKKFALSEIESS